MRTNVTPIRRDPGSWKAHAAALAFVIGLLSCAQQGIAPPPNLSPQKANQLSLEPQSWDIFYSSGMPPHPSPEATGMWSFDLPNLGLPPSLGHVNYVQTPFQTTTTPQEVSITFRIESNLPTYDVMDGTDIAPATFHIFFEQQNDDLIDPDGRWWAHGGYQLGSQDNQTITLTVPFSYNHWSNVYGYTDPQRFATSWQNVGWVGVTFGGQYFWGHGVAMGAGSARFVLINFQIM